MSENKTGEIVIYQTDDGQTKIDVRYEDETVGLRRRSLWIYTSRARRNIEGEITIDEAQKLIRAHYQKK